jgi:hypothetical protein
MKQMTQLKKPLRFGRLMACIFILLTFAIGATVAQPLDGDNRVSITLDDGTEVTLLGKAKTGNNNDFTGDYYYLPVGLRLSKRPDGVPEFLFMKYTTEADAAAGGVQGALMHFLMQWGLTAKQEAELESKLKVKLEEKKKDPRWGPRFKKITKVKVMGPVDVQPIPEGSFQIYSASLSDPASSQLIQSGRAPALEGGKAVVASKMDKNTAQLMAASLEETSSVADLSVTLNYQYSVMLPAIDASVIINWSKVSETMDSLATEYKHTYKSKRILWYKKSSSTYSYDEMHKLYQKSIENKSVQVNIVDRSLGDETSAMVLEAFMNYFTNALTDKDTSLPPVAPEGDKDDDAPNNKKGNYYKLNKVKLEKNVQKGRETIRLNYRRAVPRYIDVTGNLRSWYDGVKDNPSCVTAVNLNDPFFEHRNISFIIDGEVEDIFGQVVNYVNVEVRKKRSSGNDFTDRVTVDKMYLAEKGVTVNMTYARGEDENPDLYEYRTQWSIRGGKTYPKDPVWIKGDWSGVTLYPPVKIRTVEFESDIDELKDRGITRVTAQVRFRQFGQEEEANIHISAAKGEGLVEKNIFIDDNSKGYAYRLVINHKTHGKLILPWEVRMNDDYIYATLPDDLDDVESDIFKEAKQVADEVVSKAKESVLDKFSELFD